MTLPEPNKKDVWSWAFYDFANSSYGVLVLTLLFPVFYRAVLAGGTGKADFYWGLIYGISVALAALASPIFGALADHAKNKKELLVGLTLVAVLGTAALYFAPGLGLLASSILFIITNLGYSVGITVYDSFMQDVSTKQTVGRVSGLGWGLGYIGGLVAMVAIYPFYGHGFAGANQSRFLLAFPLVAAYFLLFALPAFLFLRSRRHATHPPALSALPAAWRSLVQLIRDWRSHKNILLFQLAFYLLNDGLNTIFAFIGIYATTTLGLSLAKTTLFYVTVQLVGFPATIITGRLSDKWGAKPILIASTLGWMLVVLLLLLKPAFGMLMVIAVLGGIVIGSSQAPARSMLAKMVPAEMAGQFFGLNGLASKMSASLGPIIFGAISWATGSQRIALASVLVFFIASILVLRGVREPMPGQPEKSQ